MAVINKEIKTPGETPSPAVTPATTRQKVFLAAWLIAALAALLVVWTEKVSQVDDRLSRENRVRWAPVPPVVLKPGPPEFRYDSERKELVYVGTIDAKAKFELLALLPDTAKALSPEVEPSFWTAIDKLAFVSNRGLSGLLVSLLWLGGLSGAIGAHLRSFTAFVGNASFKNQLDVLVWWPYYVTRPFTGFIIGLTIVAIVQGGFLAIGKEHPTGALAWVAVAILAGFGDDEFTQKLRQLTKTLFGEGDKNVKLRVQTGSAVPGGGRTPETTTVVTSGEDVAVTEKKPDK